MKDSFLKVATLDDEGRAAVRALESALGKHIMAFEPGLQIAELDAEQVRQIKGVEETLGVTLLVFEP